MEWMIMPLRRYAEFSGRSRRLEYWAWVLFQFAISIVFFVLVSVAANVTLLTLGDSLNPVALGAGFLVIFGLWMLVSLFLLIPSLAVTVRRLHDTNRSGWWILAPLVPYVVGWTAFVMAVGAGKPGSAEFGGLALIGMLSFLATLVLGLVVFVFMLLEGTPGPNRYGPDPKGRTAASVFS